MAPEQSAELDCSPSMYWSRNNVDPETSLTQDMRMAEGQSSPYSHTIGQATSYFVQRHFANLKKAHFVVTHINPSETAVVTSSEFLQRAVARCLTMKLPELPAFVLMDQTAERQRPLNALINQITLDDGSVFNLRILALNELRMLGDMDYCLFSTGLDGPHSLWNLYQKWRKAGHRGTVMMDVTPLLGFPQDRLPKVGFFNSKFQDICTVYNALSDAESRDIFLRAIKSIEAGDPGYLEQSPYEHYLHPIVRAEPGDTVIDGGPADGQTTAMFARQVGPTGKVIAFEPVKRYVAETWEQTQSFTNVVIENLGLWSGKQTFHIENRQETSKLTTEPTELSEECRATDLDSYLAEKGVGCDMIKLDIEGAETECLKGAMATIRKYRPKLQISIYHRPIDYIDLALMIIRENLDYDFYIGHHLPWFNESVLYAIPRK